MVEVSVVIPVYQAAGFVEEAVHSVLVHPCVKEVILVEDGSKDHSLQVCQSLAAADRVTLLTHPDHANKGAGPSRNLGILHAQTEWIAFLDADDLWLPNRFDTTFDVLDAHPDADGVYECLGIQFESEEVESRWRSHMGIINTTLKAGIPPEQLISRMAPLGKEGWFSGDALLVRKELLLACGLYSDLRLNQDTELFMKLAIKGSLYPGNIESPVAARRVHSGNRVSIDKGEFFKRRLLLWRQFLSWCRQEGVHGKVPRLAWYQWWRAIYVVFKATPTLKGRLRLVAKECAAILDPGWWGILFFRR